MKARKMKLRDKVDFNKLADFGFEKITYSDDNICWFKKVYMSNDNDDRVCYRIQENNRIVQITRLDGELDSTLLQLFEANLIESELI